MNDREPKEPEKLSKCDLHVLAFIAAVHIVGLGLLIFWPQ